MKYNDKKLLDVYMVGFRDELNSKTTEYKDVILLKAYNLGKIDAIIGDDVSSSDDKTNEEILKQIKSS